MASDLNLDGKAVYAHALA